MGRTKKGLGKNQTDRPSTNLGYGAGSMGITFWLTSTSEKKYESSRKSLRYFRIPPAWPANRSGFLTKLRIGFKATHYITIRKVRRPLRSLLVWASEATNFKISKRDVLCFSTRGSSSPKSKRGWLHFGSHELDDLAWSQTKLRLNRVECGSVLPGHLNNTVNICRCK